MVSLIHNSVSFNDLFDDTKIKLFKLVLLKTMTKQIKSTL